MTNELPSNGPEKKTFDMYHFFSRRDIWLIGIILLGDILAVTYFVFYKVSAAYNLTNLTLSS